MKNKNQDKITLNFSLKDCILEQQGSISFKYSEKDKTYVEGKEKREEIFFNQVIARDEIDRLLDRKALVNWKKYSKDDINGASINDLKRNSDGTIQDNLIIKGNNLVALHSIKSEFAGKVKLIYIDPPYNTGNDGFKYNDKFSHSTWLTFMKNRLEIARELLRDDGVIFVSLDDKEAHYCKVLMDEIFKDDNFLADIIWNSTKSVTNTAIISVAHTHQLVYFKSKDYYVKNRSEFRSSEDGVGFSNPDNDPRGIWKADPFQVGGWRPNQQYEITNPNTGKVYTPNEGCSWKNDYKKFQELLTDNRIVFGKDGKSSPQRKRFLSEAEERGKVSKTLWTDLETTTNGTQHLKKIFGKAVFNNPKPEGLIQRVIELATTEGDLILDFHLGSGTTAAVAHKMNRQYIGIEQMDYIETIAVERLKKVIEGEQGGISKSVNWNGGGEFVYCELAKWNETAKEKIESMQSLDALIELFDKIYDTYFLDYNVCVKDFKEKIIHEEAFKNLSLEEQKSMFIRMLDVNQMYVNESEMMDKMYNISSTDINMTDMFYGNIIK